MRRPILAAIGLALLVLALPGTGGASAAPIREVPYGPGEREDACIFPAATSNAPTVIYVRGGWWRPTEGCLHESQMEILQAKGLTVIDMDYPDPVPRFPAEDEAVEHAVTWAHQHAAEYNGNPNNVELFGSSAGGQLVSMVADRLEPGSVRAVAELSAPGVNFVTLVTMLQKEEGPEGGKLPVAKALGCQTLLNMANCTEAEELRWSPMFDLPSVCPAWLLAYGAVEDLRGIPAQTEEMRAATEAAACETQLFVAPKGHAMEYFGRIKPTLAAFLLAH